MQKIRKAVIPAAGFGTRLFPATKAVKKEFFPIVDATGQAKPAILAIVEEAVSAGIESIGIVVQERDRALFEDFFYTPPPYFNKLSVENQARSQDLQALGERVTILTQAIQDGFGHAVFCARDWVDGDPFLLMLGDHIYASETEMSCVRQLLAVYEQTGKSAIAVETTPAETISHRGCIMGTWQEPDRLLTVTALVEKPEIDYALQHLHVDGMAPDRLLAVFGLYALIPQIFDYLEDDIRHNRRDRGEFQLTSCLHHLQQDAGMVGTLIQGRAFDIGLPETYWQTAIDFRRPLP